MNLPFRHPDRPLRAAPTVPKRINLVVAMVAIVILLVAVSLPTILNASSTISTVQHGTDLTGCRAIYAAQVTDANTNLNLANARSAVLQDKFLIAIGGPKNPATYIALFSQIDTAQQAISAAAEQVGKANEKYQNAVSMSNTDPVRFIQTCHAVPVVQHRSGA